MKIALCAFCVALGLAAFIQRNDVPITQVDVFARVPVAPALASLDLSVPIRDAFATLTPAQRQSFLRPTLGAAFATDTAERFALGAVTVRSVAQDRVRIRVAAVDQDAAAALSETVRQHLLTLGVKERLRIESRASGTARAWFLWFAAAIAGTTLLAELIHRSMRRLRRRRLALCVMPAGAST